MIESISYLLTKAVHSIIFNLMHKESTISTLKLERGIHESIEVYQYNELH